MSNVKGKQKKKVRKNIQTGVAHIAATFNNTIVSITDVSGNVVSWSSSGTCGFKGGPEVAVVCAHTLPERNDLRRVGIAVAVLQHEWSPRGPDQD